MKDQPFSSLSALLDLFGTFLRLTMDSAEREGGQHLVACLLYSVIQRYSSSKPERNKYPGANTSFTG